jgi:hypothetical protein
MVFYARLDFGIKVEEGFQAGLQLLLNLVLTALQDVHRNVGLAPILQFNRRIADLAKFVGRQEPHSINKCQVRHL